MTSYRTMFFAKSIPMIVMRFVAWSAAWSRSLIRPSMSRCTQFPESRFFVFNPFPGFECMVVALKPRNFALKPRTKFRLKFVRDLNAETNLSHFLAAVLILD
jgi:hypothetical protein